MNSSAEPLSKEDRSDTVQVDHLISLVGGNPLPIAVSALLLLRPGGLLTLLHSESSHAVAAQLKSLLTERMTSKVTRIECKELDEASPAAIRKVIAPFLSDSTSESIGLDYTGGTKAMSAHAYALFNEQFQNSKHAALTSYLDARNHVLWLEVLREGGREPKRIPLGNRIKFSIQEMMMLHNWWNDTSNYKTSPVLTVTADRLTKLFANDEFRRSWRQWLEKEVKAKCEKDNGSPKSKNALGQVTITVPLEFSVLNEVFAALRNELQTPEEGICIIQEKVGQDHRALYKWLCGEWLENAVASYLLDMEDLQLNDVAVDINACNPQFQLDVAAVHGHRTFFISCTTDDTPRLTKSKVIEVALRAKQLGGDEAAYCLVCCSNDPIELERNLRSELGERVRVFGIKDFSDLPGRLRHWLETEIKG